MARALWLSFLLLAPCAWAQAPTTESADTPDTPPAEDAPAEQVAPVASPPAAPVVRIIWFGRTYGVSGHYGRNRAHLAFFEKVGEALEAFNPVADGPRVFAHDGRVLFAKGGLKIERLHAFLKAGPFEREVVAERWPVRSGPLELLFEHPSDEKSPVLDLLDAPGDPPETDARLVRFTNAAGAVLHAVELPEADPTRPLEPDPYRWETRFVFEADATPKGGAPRHVFSVGRPVHDGARRVTMIERLRDEAPGPVLVLGAGNDIEDYSFVVTGQPDLQRPHTWAAFRRIGLTALAAGAHEAAFGLDVLQKQAQQNEVTVLSANVGGEHPLAGWRLHAAGDVQVLLVGLTDPSMDAVRRLRGFGTRPLTEPAAAVRAAVEAARERLGRRPDLVVAFGLLNPTDRAALMRDCGDIDLLLADFEDHGVSEIPVQTAVLDPALRARDRHPLVVAPAGSTRLGVVDLRFERVGERLRPQRVESRAVPVFAEVEPQPELFEAVQRTRQDAYKPVQVQLLPDLGPDIAKDPTLQKVFASDPSVRKAARSGGTVPPRITADMWRHLVTNALAVRFDAEIVLAPPLPVPWPLSGSVSKLEALADTNVPDEVAVVHLTGEQVQLLAANPRFGWLVSGGVDPVEGTVRGRLIDLRERYRVITTDGVLAEPALAPVFLGVEVESRFALDDGEYEADGDGQPVKLRDVVLDTLAARADDTARLLHWMKPAGKTKASRWVVDARGIALEASFYSALGEQEAYEQVRETRVTTQEHRLLGTRGDFFISRQTPDLDWVNQLHWVFAKAYYVGRGAEDQETADEGKASTELQMHTWGLDGPTNGVPFLNVAYVTEFTPTEFTDDAGVERENPRKKRVEAALGLLWTGEIITSARIAAVVGHDFAEEEPDPQVGLLGVFKLTQPIGPLLWNVDLEARYYIPGVGLDTPSTLGATLALRTGLDVPIFSGLIVGVFADLFGYRGQHSTTEDPGASLITGLALKFDRFFKPGY